MRSAMVSAVPVCGKKSVALQTHNQPIYRNLLFAYPAGNVRYQASPLEKHVSSKRCREGEAWFIFAAIELPT